ncbi:hypothetical protein BDQ17DRAFT_1404602 [Cyathus striatus]|nr:hypothetical protein BDQ17DRAFT_1404602 [Cyathus striatus]
MPSAYYSTSSPLKTNDSSPPNVHSNSEEGGNPAETYDPRPSYRAVQNGKVEGNATNIAGVDLAAFVATMGTNLSHDVVVKTHREVMKTHMETAKSFESTQNMEVSGDAYNAAGIGYNPNGASSQKN